MLTMSTFLFTGGCDFYRHKLLMALLQKTLADGESGGLSNYHMVMEFVLLLTLRTLKAAYVNIVAHLLIDVNRL